MEKFIKTTAEELTGVQKAAILMAELGPLLNDNYGELCKYLKLTTEEMEKIRRAMENFKPYLQTEPKNVEEIYREQAVLAEAINYGRRKGIFTPIPKDQLKNTYVKKIQSDDITEIVKENPDAVAKLLSQWLDE
ncbi:hypothetical protein [Treponema sp.]|uniref:hypothetical protein n=1 Tax=Treponema sp. TaxID=166 RepID=UPI00298E012E|nr:hypothetical protein [Treponema sp.]MCQ2241666.1 hypothetical protein [Treponema sp.]